MISDEAFVGSVAIGLAVIALVIALGPWQRPYQIRSVAAVSARFGKPAGRLVWLLFAIVAGGSGVSILSEIRPNYAAPTRIEDPAQ